MADTLPRRADGDTRYTWDLESLFATPEDWDAEAEAAGADIPALETFRGRLGQDAATLLEFLTARDALTSRLNRLGPYAMLGVHEDNTDQAAIGRRGRLTALLGRWFSVLAFADPEILAIGRERLEGFLADEPRLEVYRRAFERLESTRQYTRSAEVEQVLGLVQEPFFSIQAAQGSLTNGELRFRSFEHAGRTHEVAQGTIDALLGDPDREVRRLAYESYADGHLALKNTLADLLVGSVRQAAFRARVRRYASTREAILQPAELPLEALDVVVNAFQANLPTWHRYWAARRRALDVDRLGPHDVFAPLGTARPRVSYEQAVEWIADGLRPLGSEYVEPMRRGLTSERWVDVYPNVGKSMNAFSSGGPGTHPFILMNFANDVDGLSTLAHEIGHSMHSYLSWEAQPLVYARYGMTAAETASNFNQALVRAHLLETNSDPDFQMVILEEAFRNFHRYFFIMPTLARLELELHASVERGRPMTADALTALCARLFQEGYGEHVEIDEQRHGITWAQFGHLYSPFYVFQYASGISAAAALAEDVREGRPGARENYLRFLRAGSSVPQLEALKIAGVDLTTPEPVNRGFEVVGRLVDRLESLLDARGD